MSIQADKIACMHCRTLNTLLIAFLAMNVLVACSDADSQTRSSEKDSKAFEDNQPRMAPWFKDATESLGLAFNHRTNKLGNYFMPQMVGSGAAMIDFDSDGHYDIYLLQNAGPKSPHKNQLFRQTPSGQFVDVSTSSGLDVPGHNMGVAVGDINNDGKPDVLITQYTGAKLFLNQTVDNTPKFVDITKPAGIDNPLWGTSASFLDYDRDGFLDLAIVNYVNYYADRWCADSSSKRDYCGPNAFDGRVTKLFRNLGPQPDKTPKFKDVTLASGIGRKRGPGLGVFCADFNGDHYPDIFVANDGKPNHLWINKKDGTFSEQADLRGLAANRMSKAEADMGIAIGDVDSDGLFDVFVTHLHTETHTLWQQKPQGIFHDKTSTLGVANTHWRGTGFGTAMADFDANGTLDLVIANGAVLRTKGKIPTDIPPGLDKFWHAYCQQNQILSNDGTGHFTDISLDNPDFSKRAAVSRGLVVGDFNNDGALDMLITRVGSPARIYLNIAKSHGSFLTITAIDPKLNRIAYGAEITVTSGKKVYKRIVNPAYSYVCSNDPRAHFGLARAGKVDQIRITWPDGYIESFPGVEANQFLTLRRGSGKPAQSK